MVDNQRDNRPDKKSTNSKKIVDESLRQYPFKDLKKMLTESSNKEKKGE